MMTAALTKRLFTFSLAVHSILGACTKHTGAATPVPAGPVAPLTLGQSHQFPARLKESSGLCYSDGALWSFGDSGNPNAIYKIDTATGAILQTITIANYPNSDWEDITADVNYIYIGDTGNNDGDRTDLKILRIKKSDIPAGTGTISITAEAINFSYTDQLDLSSNSNTNFDCEALVSIGDSLYLFTKDRGDLQTRCYHLSKNPGTYAVSPIASFNTMGKITDATYDLATRTLALLGYMDKKNDSFIWFFKNYQGENFFTGDTTRYTIVNASADWQTEGLAYISAGAMFLSCESTPTHPAALYTIKINK
jgi:hypothetical protein